MIVIEFVGLDETSYETVQEADERTHDVGLNVPPDSLSLNCTLPVGVVGEPEVSVTVMVNVAYVPGFTVKIFGDIFRDVGSIALVTEVPLLSAKTKLALSAAADRVSRQPKNDNKTHVVRIKTFGRRGSFISSHQTLTIPLDTIY